jgi:hypothetical protein
MLLMGLQQRGYIKPSAANSKAASCASSPATAARLEADQRMPPEMCRLDTAERLGGGARWDNTGILAAVTGRCPFGEQRHR